MSPVRYFLTELMNLLKAYGKQRPFLNEGPSVKLDQVRLVRGYWVKAGNGGL